MVDDWAMGIFTKSSSLGLGGLPPSSTHVRLCSHWLDELIISGQIDIFFTVLFDVELYSKEVGIFAFTQTTKYNIYFLSKLSRQRLFIVLS